MKSTNTKSIGVSDVTPDGGSEARKSGGLKKGRAAWRVSSPTPGQDYRKEMKISFSKIKRGNSKY